MSDLAYRLRIRTPDDSADALVLTSLRGGTNPYLVGAPTGDGATIDIVTGAATVGSYRIQAADPDLGGGTRPVTSVLVNAARQQQLLSRRAYIETSTDGGATWSAMVTGFVNQLRLVSAIVWEFTVGDTQLIEQSMTLFQTTDATFDAVSCLIGGPVRGGFGPIADYGAWRMKVLEVVSGQFVHLAFVEGYVPVSLGNFNATSPTPGYRYARGSIGNDALAVVVNAAKPYFVRDQRWSAYDFVGYFPNLEARVEQLDGTLVGRFTPLGALIPTANHAPWGSAALVGPGTISGTPGVGSVFVAWTGLNGQPDQPSVGDEFGLYVYPTTISETNPMHLVGHPVDLITQLWSAAGIAYSASAASAAKDAIGADLVLVLRITAQKTMAELLTSICGVFGLGMRTNTAGEREVIAVRIHPASAPSTTITMDDLRAPPSEHFNVDEQTIVNKVVLQTQALSPWLPPTDGTTPQRPADGIQATQETFNVTADDYALVGEHAASYTLDGAVYRAGWVVGFITYVGFAEVPGTTLATALAVSLFNRRQHGGAVTALPCLRSVTAQLGDIIALDLPFRPNDNARGGTRVVQVIGRQEEAGGPILTVEDLGTTDQPTVVPTVTLAKDTTTDPKRVAILTITNAAALETEGDSVRVEIAFGASPSSWTLAAFLTPSDLAAGYSTLRLPEVDAGALVNARLRSEQPGRLASSWSATAAVTLDALPAPTGLAATAVDGDDTQQLLTWALSDTTVPVAVKLKEHTGGTWRVVDTLPPGSLQTTLRGLATATEYDVEVLLQEAAPHAGASAAASLSFTTGSTVATLAAPDDPRPFAGTVDPATGGVLADGTFGMDVVARELPSVTVFELAVETAVGAGTYGSYQIADHVASVQGGRTRWSALAPNDGLRRQMRAKAIREGADDSAYTPAVTVLPWTALAPEDYPVAIPSDFALAANVQGDPASPVAWVVATWTRPGDSQFDHMEYSVSARRTGDADYGAAVLVIGTGRGTDRIVAQPGTDVQVAPVAVTVDGTRTVSDTAFTITVPPFAPPAPSVSASAASGAITYAVTFDAATKYVRWWVERFTDATVPASAISVENVGTEQPRLEPGALTSAQGLALDATNDWELATFVPYDGVNNRGTPIRLRTQRATPPVPSAPTGATNTSTTSNSVTNAVGMPASVTNFDYIRPYRNGVRYGSDIARTAGAGTNQSVTHTGLGADETDSWQYSGVSSAGGESAKTAPLSVTTAPGTIPTPDIGFVTYDTSAKAFTIQVVPSAGTPAGVKWHLKAGTTNPPTTEIASAASTSTTLMYSQLPGPHDVTYYFEVWGTLSGWTDSGPSTVQSCVLPHF